MISAIHLDPTGRAWPVVSPGEGGASVAHGCKRAWRDDTLSRREAARPRAGMAGPMELHPAATAVAP